MAPGDDSAARRSEASRRPLSSFALALALMAAATFAALLGFHPPDLSTEALVLLAGVAACAHWCGRWPSVAAALLAALTFNFLFIEPRFTFAIAEPSYVLAFVAMTAVGLGLAGLVAAVRGHAAEARAREADLAALLSLTRSLAEANEAEAVGRVTIVNLLDVVVADVAVFVVAPGTRLETASLVASHGPTDWIAPELLVAARAHASDDDDARRLEATSPLAQCSFVPMRSQRGTEGVLALRLCDDAATLDAHQHALVSSFAQQAAEALERIAAASERMRARNEVETERLRSTLLASVSHDLRTPLTTITASASRLLHEGDALDRAARDELAASVLTESQRMNELVANLLFATRLEAGAVALRTQWTSLAEVVASALERPPLRDRPVEVEISPDLPLLDADPVLLEQAIYNLLDNGVRHTAPGTHVAVRARVESQQLVVDVLDDGPGIAADRRALLFRRFARSSQGLGLGLAIADGIVRAHGGSLQLEPAVQQGSCFRIRIPLPAAQPRLPETESMP